MCKQDIQIGRRLASRPYQFNVTVGSNAKALAAMPDRIAVAVVLDTGAFTVAGDAAAIGYMVGSVLTPLAAVTADHPSVVLRVQDYGSILLGDLYVTALGPSQGGMFVTDLFLTQSLEDF